MSDLPEHVARNRVQWDAWAAQYVESGERDWARDEPHWGIWSVPESQVGMLPHTLCLPDEEDGAATDRLVRPAFGLSRMEFAGDSSVEFHLSHGDWIRLLRRSGFDVVDQIDVRPPEGASTRYPFVTLDWARQWPCEEIWKARRVGAVPTPRAAMPTSAGDWP